MAEERSHQELHTMRDFPVAAESHKKVLSDGVPTLWHEALEVKLFFSSGTQLVIGNEVFTSRAGDIFVINPCEPHSTCDRDGTSDYHMMNLDVSRMAQLGTAPLPEAVSELCAGKRRIATRIDDALLRSLIAQAVEAAADPGRQMTLLGMAYVILDELLRNYSFGVPAGGALQNVATQTAVLDSAITYIHRHYTEKISIAALARSCAVSEKYFCKLFRLRMGMTAVAYIHTLRINHAILILRSENCRIADAAERCGFPDVNYFFRVFRQYKGESVTSFLGRKN